MKEINRSSQQTLRALGSLGEQMAVTFLENKGYTILDLNWHGGRSGEIDVVARVPGEDILVFVEVKTRRSLQCGSPFEAITHAKKLKILDLARQYLQAHAHSENTQVRFDVIGVFLSKSGQPLEILHIENAFDE